MKTVAINIHCGDTHCKGCEYLSYSMKMTTCKLHMQVISDDCVNNPERLGTCKVAEWGAGGFKESK